MKDDLDNVSLTTDPKLYTIKSKMNASPIYDLDYMLKGALGEKMLNERDLERKYNKKLKHSFSAKKKKTKTLKDQHLTIDAFLKDALMSYRKKHKRSLKKEPNKFHNYDDYNKILENLRKRSKKPQKYDDDFIETMNKMYYDE